MKYFKFPPQFLEPIFPNINLLLLNLILALTFHGIIVNAQVNWQSGAGGVQWAFACDFDNHEMGSAHVPGEQCGGKCMSTIIRVEHVG